MKIKKLSAILAGAVCALAIAFGLTACDNGGGSEPAPLQAPEISIDAAGKITWEPVENADAYDIYQGENSETYVTSVAGEEYKITEKNPGTYYFSVVATSEKEQYLDSPASNVEPYTVKLSLLVVVDLPQGYPGQSVTVELHNNDGLVDSKQVAITAASLSAGYVSAEFSEELGSYTARVTDLSSGYVATRASLSVQSRNASITVVEKTAQNSLIVGDNAVTVEEREEKTYVFVAEKSATHTLSTDATAGIVVDVNGGTVIDAAQGLQIGNFTAEEGEVIIITVVGESAGSYNLRIDDYEIPQYINVLDSFDIDNPGKANIIQGSCVRYIRTEDIEWGIEYKFLFITATLGTRSVKITVGDAEYTGENSVVIAFNSADAEEDVIEIKIEIISSDGTTGGGRGNIAFFVYPSSAD